MQLLIRYAKKALHLHLAPAAHISIMLLRPIEQGANAQQKQQLPSSTTAAGHRRVRYQCASLWSGLLGWIRTNGLEQGLGYAQR